MNRLIQKLWASLTAAVLCCTILSPDYAVAASGTDTMTPDADGFYHSGYKSLAKLSEQEINDLIFDNSTLSDPDSPYSTEPSLTAPYAAGTLRPDIVENGLDRLNDYRRLAGLADVAIQDSYAVCAQTAALLNAVNDRMTHTPAQPDDMDTALYNTGYQGASSSNIAWFRGSPSAYGSLDQSVHLWMEDSDSSNIEALGHRRWFLNPTMGCTGFGSVSNDTGTYTAAYAFDRSAEESDYDFISWPPSGNMPENTTFFTAAHAWSISFHPEKVKSYSSSDITVTLKRMSDGKTWTFSDTSADGDFYVNTDFCGVPNCIIFRPSGLRAYDGLYTVTVSGLRSAKTGNAIDFRYQVSFYTAQNCADAGLPYVSVPDPDSETPQVLLHVGDKSFLFTDSNNIDLTDAIIASALCYYDLSFFTSADDAALTTCMFHIINQLVSLIQESNIFSNPDYGYRPSTVLSYFHSLKESATVPETTTISVTTTAPVTTTAASTTPDFPGESTTVLTTAPATEYSTEPITEPIFEPSTEPATERPTEPVTEPATERPTEPVMEPATEPSSSPSTVPETTTIPQTSIQPTTAAPSEATTATPVVTSTPATTAGTAPTESTLYDPDPTAEPTTDSAETTAISLSYQIGDLDGNGTVTAADARIVLRVAAHLETIDESASVLADMNADGAITASDARLILRVSARLEHFPIKEDHATPSGDVTTQSPATTSSDRKNEDKPAPTTSGHESTTAAVTTTTPAAETVYITPTGNKYHRAGCRTIKKESTPISRSEAIEQGYEPCKVCKP